MLNQSTYKALCARPGEAIICNSGQPVTLSVRVPRCQKLQMTGLTRSGTRCFIAVPIWQQWASKGYTQHCCCHSFIKYCQVGLSLNNDFVSSRTSWSYWAVIGCVDWTGAVYSLQSLADPCLFTLPPLISMLSNICHLGGVNCCHGCVHRLSRIYSSVYVVCTFSPTDIPEPFSTDAQLYCSELSKQATRSGA